MMSKKLYLLNVTCLILFIIPSCKNTSQPTNPNEVKLSMEIISFQDAPSIVDSNLCYKKLFVEWNKSNWRDTLKADSLAEWFAQSQYQITDMWFPNVSTFCLYPINTENIVTLKLLKPDTNLKSQGYYSTTSVVDPCWSYYRHYIFTRVKKGT